jgi:hypothetical protein
MTKEDKVDESGDFLDTIAEKEHKRWMLQNQHLHPYRQCGSHKPCRFCDGRATKWDHLDEEKKLQLETNAKLADIHSERENEMAYLEEQSRSNKVSEQLQALQLQYMGEQIIH